MKAEEVVSGFIWRCFLCTLLQYASNACILLLNGWQPLTVPERAELADVVLTAYTRSTYKDTRGDPDGHTYSAEFQIYNILKGKRLVEKIEWQNSSNAKVFNISNFGDTTMCYADVNKGESYLLFLDYFDNRLSAKYDDIFGAIADYTLENEQLVLQTLGWNQWTEWTPCSKSCSGGQQNRVRVCKKKNCDGFNNEQRMCNAFTCSGVKNLLSILKLKSLPKGVSIVDGRPSAFKIEQTAELRVPTNVLYKKYFPHNFSILVTARPVVNNQGLVLAITNLKGHVILSVQVGSNPLFLFADQNNLPGMQASPQFQVNLSDGHWHQFAYSIQGQNVTMHVDCVYKVTRPLLRSMNPILSINGILSLGSSFGLNLELEKKFEGDIEQLILVDDPAAAQQHCSDVVGPIKEDLAIENLRSLTNDRHLNTVDGYEDGSGHNDEEEDEESSAYSAGLEWSSWGPCSVSCGKGSQHRRLECIDESKCTEDSEQIETKLCRLKACPIKCNPACQNGGQCMPPGVCSCPEGYARPTCTPICALKCKNGGECIALNKCRCPVGYEGNQCQSAACPLGCKHGGHCIAPNKCICASGYGGDDCGSPICFPACQNGGLCLYPYYCHCKTGSSGTFCEKFTCKPSCKNNGKCISLNKCNCPLGYRGDLCESAQCRGGCGNGTCVSPNKCICNSEFHGKHCEKKKCIYESVKESFMRSYKQPRKEVSKIKCGLWKMKTCVQSRIHYEIVYRRFYRTTYKCIG